MASRRSGRQDGEVKIVCPKCKGCGKVLLRGSALKTLRLMQKLRKPVTQVDLAGYRQISTVAVSLHLKKLMKAGFVKRSKRGEAQPYWYEVSRG